MRITFILPYAGLAGGTRVVAIYAEQLKARGHDVVVVSTPQKPVPWRRKVKSLLKGKGWPDTRDDGPSHMDGVDVDHRVIDRWRPVVDADVPDADVVVATWWETAEWVAAFSKEKGAKAYFVQHHETHPGQPLGRVEATYRLPLHKIAVSRWLVNVMRDQYGDSLASLVPNSVDLDQFCADCRTKQTQPTVGMMYSPAKWKRSDLALEAVRKARQSHPDLRLLAFGVKRPAAARCSEISEFWTHPDQDTIRAIYGCCDAWLFSSTVEGFGLPLLEAMACRTPVIGTRAGAAQELIGEGGGVLLNTFEPEEMAEAIVRVAEMDASSWRRMSDAAYTTATGYTWEDATDLFENALHRAVDRAAEGEIAGGVKELASL